MSHSHMDIEAVRQIRNVLEQRGHNPLLFYLKCLAENDAILPDLLHKEIEARNFFILCVSEGERASRWVPGRNQDHQDAAR